MKLFPLQYKSVSAFTQIDINKFLFSLRLHAIKVFTQQYLPEHTIAFDKFHNQMAKTK